MINTVAVFGNGGAGKTAVSSALAYALSKRDKNIIVLSPDRVIPAIPIYLPKLKNLEPKNSLGVLLSGSINEDALKGKLHLHPKNDRIAFAGLISGETSLTYDEFTKDSFLSLKETLNKTPFDYLIVDCTSNLMSDYLSFMAVETADIVIRVLSSDVAGIEYDKSTTVWQGGGINFKPDEQIKILNKTSKTLPVSEISEVVNPQYELPFSVEVQNKLIAGDVLGNFDFKDGVLFSQQINYLADDVLGRDKNIDG